MKRKLKEAIKSKGSAIAIALSVTAVVLVICGVGCCKYKKTCCFKEEGMGEGGDRETFKREIKGKNSHKVHAKESLVPTF